MHGNEAHKPHVPRRHRLQWAALRGTNDACAGVPGRVAVRQNRLYTASRHSYTDLQCAGRQSQARSWDPSVRTIPCLLLLCWWGYLLWVSVHHGRLQVLLSYWPAVASPPRGA